MNLPNLVWSIFRKVIDIKNTLVNKKPMMTYLQILCFFNCQQLLTAFQNHFKMNDLVYYNYVNKSL